METLQGELVAFETAEQLKTLLSAEGPCLSIYMTLAGDTAAPERNENQNGLRWSETFCNLEGKVDQYGRPGRDLVSSVEHWQAVSDALRQPEAAGAKAIAVFRAGNLFTVAVMAQPTQDRAVLGPHFYIRPLLAELVRPRTFYLLALSEKNTRLLRCTWRSSEEVALPPGTQTDFETWMNQDKPDHTAVDNAMTTGTQGASGPNALAPKGSDREKKGEYLLHFFRQIDRGVNEVLKGKTEPLVLCAVEYETPLYREVNHYGQLAAEEVRGAPNGLKSGEMHARAIEALERCYLQKIDETIADWNHRVGGGASSRLKEVVTAAHEGRVLTLLISDSDEKIGVYDEATHSVKARETGSPNDEDIMNEAAIQTILHAGKVLVAPHNKMPNGNSLAAIYRY